MRFAKVLRKRRIELGYTQEKAAEMLNIKVPNYSLYENDRCFPSKEETLEKFAAVFQLDIKYIRDLVALNKGELPSFVLEDKERMSALYNECVARYLSI